MARHGMLLSSIVVLVQSVLVTAVAASENPVSPMPPVSTRHPLLVLEQNRASIVQRIVGEWAVELPSLPANRRISAEQLSEALWQLRSDRLLAASLAGSFTTIEALIADSHHDNAVSLQRVATKALGDANADLTFTPVNPCRIVDTRVAGGALTPGVQRTFDGFSANFSWQGGTATNCGMPNGVAAIAMNVYAVNPTNLGFIKVWGANGAEPAVSTVNYQVGITAIATGAIVPVDSGNLNRFIAKSPATVHFVADVVGYFRAPSGAGPYFVNGGNMFGATAKLGTLDNQPLELYVDNQRTMRYVFYADTPNVIGGHANNSVGVGAAGQTVAGGGASGSNCYDPQTNSFTRSCANFALNNRATVGGGVANVADCGSCTVAGGSSNTASGFVSTIPGGRFNTASGDYSFAAGYLARASANGCFVFADSSIGQFTTCAFPNEFIARAVGGVYFFTGGTSDATYTGAQLPAGASAWIAYSDRAGKDNVSPVEPGDVLSRLVAIPIATWNWKTQDASIRHMGPMAQDFRAAFGLGESARTISTVDADGVALAAIQGLYQLVQEKDARIAALEQRLTDVESLRGELAALRLALVELLQAKAKLAGRN